MWRRIQKIQMKQKIQRIPSISSESFASSESSQVCRLPILQYHHLMVKVLLFGSRGYLGGQFLSLFPDAVCPAADIADSVAVAKALDAEKPDVVINAAGKTGRPNVDWCEDHKLETIRSNVTGPLVLLEECGKRGMYWVHMGSGCIYQGDKGGRGFDEEDSPNFSGSFYSRTKAWSDRMLREFPVLQLRIRMPFDGSTEPRNLLMKLRGYSRVLDVQNSITYLPDFLKAAAVLIEKRATGLYNVVNSGSFSPFQLMEAYRDTVDPAHTFERLALDDLSDVVTAGRSNCILSIDKLRREGIELQHISEAADQAMRLLKENLRTMKS